MANAVSELRLIPFGVLIGQPLKAVVEAQALAAQTTVDFIHEVGFRKPESGSEAIFDPLIEDHNPDLGELRYVNFKYNKLDAAGNPQNAELTVPFLSILPIPLLRVDEAIIEFNAKLTDFQEYSQRDTNTRKIEYSAGGGFSFGLMSARSTMRGSVASERTAQGVSRYTREYTMRVYVRAVQDDIPAGLAKVFQILEDSIREKVTGQTPTPQ